MTDPPQLSERARRALAQAQALADDLQRSQGLLRDVIVIDDDPTEDGGAKSSRGPTSRNQKDVAPGAGTDKPLLSTNKPPHVDATPSEELSSFRKPALHGKAD